MEIRPIHTDDDFKAILHEVSAYFDNEPEPGSPEGDRFEVLLTLVKAYETKHFPIDLPDSPHSSLTSGKSGQPIDLAAAQYDPHAGHA